LKSCILSKFWILFRLGLQILQNLVGLGLKFKNPDWIWIAKYESLLISAM